MSFIDDKEIVIEASSFLLKKGYILEDIDEYGLTYQSKKIRIDIGYGRYGDLSGINILFKKKFDSLDVAWTAFIIDNYKVSHESLERVLQLLEYLKEYYKKLTNLKYSKEVDIKIREYVRKNNPEFAWIDEITKQR